MSAPISANVGTALLKGVLSPAVTPFKADLSPDTARFSRHCTWLLEHGCAGLAVFGTNSEANSLSVGERMDLLEGLVASGVPAARLMPGTGCCALEDSVRLTAHATGLGCAGSLMLPPFYYKGVPEEGLFRSYSEIIQRVAHPALKIYLYHIPPVSQVAITRSLVERLLKAYPETVVGVKDSSGDWQNTLGFLEYAKEGFQVFAGSETFLLQNMRHGGVGCITAGANVNPGQIHEVYRRWQEPEADALQAGIDKIREILQAHGPMIGTLKAVIAAYANDPAWKTVRPPLVEAGAAQAEALLQALRAAGFTMPGLV